VRKRLPADHEEERRQEVDGIPPIPKPTRGLTEEVCQKRAAEYNDGRHGRGWKAYYAVSFTPVRPPLPVCAYAPCGWPVLPPGRRRV
jgi:hypothetical protein